MNDESIPPPVSDLIHLFKELNLDRELIEKVRVNLSANFTDLDHWLDLSSALRRMREYHASWETYEKAHLLFPENPTLYNNQSILLSEWGRHEEAYAALEKAIQLKPDYANAYANMGRLFEKLHRFEQAITYYRRVLEIDPNHILSINNMGLCYQGLKDVNKAKEMYQQALALNPDYTDSLFNLAGLYLQENDRASAEKLLDRLLQLHPNDQEAIRMKKRLADTPPSSFQIGLPPIDEKKILIRASLNYDHNGVVIKPNLTPAGENIINTRDFDQYEQDDLISRVGFKAYDQHQVWENVRSNLQKIVDGEIPKKDFFISYRWRNKATEAFVEKMVSDLLERGYSVLYDRHAIKQNPEIGASEFIAQACECQFAICILTKEYRALVEKIEPINAVLLGEDGWLLDEWELLKHHANHNILKLMGIWLSDVVVPYPFTKDTCLDFRNHDGYPSQLDTYFPARKFMVTGLRADKTGRTISGISKSDIDKTVDKLKATAEFSEIIVHY